MDRTLAFLSGVLFLITATATWTFASVWVAMVFAPSLVWLGWLLVTAALRDPGSLPRTRYESRAGEPSDADAQPQDSRKLAA